MGCPGSSPGTGGQVGGQEEELEEAEQPQQLQARSSGKAGCARLGWARALGMR